MRSEGCEPPNLGHETGSWKTEFELDSGANSRWGGIGEHAIDIFRLAGGGGWLAVAFRSSDTLRFQVMAPVLIARM